MQIIQFYNGGFTWVNCRLTIIDDLLCDHFGLSIHFITLVEASIRRNRP